MLRGAPRSTSKRREKLRQNASFQQDRELTNLGQRLVIATREWAVEADSSRSRRRYGPRTDSHVERAYARRGPHEETFWRNSESDCRDPLCAAKSLALRHRVPYA